MTKRGKTILYVFSILAMMAILVYLETNLPFFRKFMPVLDNKFIIAILNLNFLLIMLLIFLAFRIIMKNYIERRRGVWGSGLKTKLTLTVFVLSMVSSVTLFILTSWFFYISIDRWIGQKIEDTVENARELSQFYYEDLFGRYEKMGGLLATTLREEKALDNDQELTRFVKKEGRSNFLGIPRGAQPFRRAHQDLQHPGQAGEHHPRGKIEDPCEKGEGEGDRAAERRRAAHVPLHGDG